MLWIVIIIGTSFWMLFDAKGIGYDKKDVKGLAGMGPVGWFFAGLLIWIIAFPLYLGSRGKLKESAAIKKASRNKETLIPTQLVIGFIISMTLMSCTQAPTPQVPAVPVSQIPKCSDVSIKQTVEKIVKEDRNLALAFKIQGLDIDTVPLIISGIRDRGEFTRSRECAAMIRFEREGARSSEITYSIELTEDGGPVISVRGL